MPEPAQKILVHKYIDWQKVEDRLRRYCNIGNHYSVRFLQEQANQGPYYCHYLAWRLGTWHGEDFFRFFDELLAVGAGLKNWDSNKSLLKDPRCDVFFSLLWELQIAKYFLDKDEVSSVEWMKEGKERSPDLKVKTKRGYFYVECYTYRKSFGIEEFINELFGRIHPSLKTYRIPYTPFTLPQNRDTEVFLDSLFRPCLDPQFIQDKIKEAKKEYPVMLPLPEGTNNFYVYMEGNDPNNYVPGKMQNACGDPEEYLKIAFDETLRNKADANNLKNHHPNILAVNFLLGGDFESAYNRQIQLKKPIPQLNFGEFLDGVLFAVCCIDKIPSSGKIILNLKFDNHLIADHVS